MKKNYAVLAYFLFYSGSLFSQISAESVPISETHSANGKFRLSSFSYDDEFPNLKGESVVYFNDKSRSSDYGKEFYKVNRSFDLYDGHQFFVAISNDGRKIIYLTDYVYEKWEGSKNVTYYIDGKLKKTYTAEEFLNCDRSKDKCSLFYTGKKTVYSVGSASENSLKNTDNEQDSYLIKNFVFNRNDTIYVVDSRKRVTLYDLNKGEIIRSGVDFDTIYPKVKNTHSSKSKITYYKYPYKYLTDIQNAKNNETLAESIGKISSLKYVAVTDSTFHKYMLHRIELSGYLDRDGKFEIEKLELDPIFDKEKVENYILTTRFTTDFIPKEVNRIYVSKFLGGYRNYDDKIAQRETIKESERRNEEFKRRSTLEEINTIYIPKNLYECFTELDKNIDLDAKNQLVESESGLLNSHIGLGMWIRNNWGINGGSRLLTYFNERNIGKEMGGNDQISRVIIEQYTVWLKGDKTAWAKWEKENPAK